MSIDIDMGSEDFFDFLGIEDSAEVEELPDNEIDELEDKISSIFETLDFTFSETETTHENLRKLKKICFAISHKTHSHNLVESYMLYYFNLVVSRISDPSIRERVKLYWGIPRYIKFALLMSEIFENYDGNKEDLLKIILDVPNEEKVNYLECLKGCFLDQHTAKFSEYDLEIANLLLFTHDPERKVIEEKIKELLSSKSIEEVTDFLVKLNDDLIDVNPIKRQAIIYYSLTFLNYLVTPTFLKDTLGLFDFVFNTPQKDLKRYADILKVFKLKYTASQLLALTKAMKPHLERFLPLHAVKLNPIPSNESLIQFFSDLKEDSQGSVLRDQISRYKLVKT